MKYAKMVEEARKTGATTEKTMLRSVEGVSRLIDKIKEAHPDLAEEFLAEQHEIMFGCHFNEDFARAAVARMHHTKGAQAFRGEHWTVEEVKDALEGHTLPSSVTQWDVYVAVNANWHDKHARFSEWFTEDCIDGNIIQDAIDFYFADEDAAPGKVWHYIHAIAE